MFFQGGINPPVEIVRAARHFIYFRTAIGTVVDPYAHTN
jgi:hypothetical protein